MTTPSKQPTKTKSKSTKRATKKPAAPKQRTSRTTGRKSAGKTDATPAAKAATIKDAHATQRRKMRAVQTHPPIYRQTLYDVGSDWYAKPGNASPEQLDDLVDRLVTLGGNE